MDLCFEMECVHTRTCGSFPILPHHNVCARCTQHSIRCIFTSWLATHVCFSRDTGAHAKCLICKCNANAPYQSALSHLEEGVEIIHESCHLNQSLSDLSVDFWRKKKRKKLTDVGGWRERLNRIQLNFSSSVCLAEDSVSCENPGLPENGYQIMSKSLYLPGQSLTFVCYQGYELIGEVAIKCILGNPSFWSGPLPLCRGETFAEFFFCGMCFVCVDWDPRPPHHPTLLFFINHWNFACV